MLAHDPDIKPHLRKTEWKHKISLDQKNNLPWKWEVVSLAWALHTSSLQQPPTPMQLKKELDHGIVLITVFNHYLVWELDGNLLLWWWHCLFCFIGEVSFYELPFQILCARHYDVSTPPKPKMLQYSVQHYLAKIHNTWTNNKSIFEGWSTKNKYQFKEGNNWTWKANGKIFSIKWYASCLILVPQSCDQTICSEKCSIAQLKNTNEPNYEQPVKLEAAKHKTLTQGTNESILHKTGKASKTLSQLVYLRGFLIKAQKTCRFRVWEDLYICKQNTIQILQGSEMWLHMEVPESFRV